MTKPQRLLLSAALAASAIVAGCSGSATPSSQASPPTQSTGPSLSPVGSGPLLPITTPEAAMAAVVAAEPQFAGIEPLDPNMIGQSAWYEVKPASGVGAFLVTITVGRGDCQAGCIERHTWTYAVAPDGSVTLLSESGDPVAPDAS
jgi:hypothetical protein